MTQRVTQMSHRHSKDKNHTGTGEREASAPREFGLEDMILGEEIISEKGSPIEVATVTVSAEMDRGLSTSLKRFY